MGAKRSGPQRDLITICFPLALQRLQKQIFANVVLEEAKCHRAAERALAGRLTLSVGGGGRVLVSVARGDLIAVWWLQRRGEDPRARLWARARRRGGLGGTPREQVSSRGCEQAARGCADL